MAIEKSSEELQKEIAELQRQRWEITARLRDTSGILRSVDKLGRAVPPHKRGGPGRPAAEVEDQPAAKRRLSSTVVKLEEGEIEVDPRETMEDSAAEMGIASVGNNNKPRFNGQNNIGFRRDRGPRMRKMDYDVPAEPVPRVLPQNEDPSLVKRNRRMLGQLLGTLEKFREEDEQRSNTEAYMRRSDSLRRAEEKSREESERLKQQEREHLVEKLRRDLTLRARVAAKAEQKRNELDFIRWCEYNKKLSNFLRTKTKPAIYYMPTKPLIDDAAIVEQQKEQLYQEWKNTRRAELSEYQKQIEETYISNVDKELERMQNPKKFRRSDDAANLQETMDKELENHRLEHGPKPRRIPGSNNDEEDDVEDIAAEDELIDDVLGVSERVDPDTSKMPDI